MPGQRLDRLCAKIKFLKIRVLLHFAIKNSKLVCKMTRDSVPKNSASVANRVFKKLQVKTRDDYVITPSEVVCSTYIHNIHKLYLSSDFSVAYIASISDPN